MSYASYVSTMHGRIGHIGHIGHVFFKYNYLYMQTSPETVLLTYFEPAESSEENFWRVVDIQLVLRQHVRQADVPNIKKLALTLKACGFAHGKTHGQRGCYAKQQCPN